MRMSIDPWGIRILDRISTCIHPGWAGQVLWAVTPNTLSQPQAGMIPPSTCRPRTPVCLRLPPTCLPGVSEPELEGGCRCRHAWLVGPYVSGFSPSLSLCSKWEPKPGGCGPKWHSQGLTGMALDSGTA